MDKTIAGLLGAVSVLVTFDAALAATPAQVEQVMKIESYGDLLDPIPNAVALLKASDAVLSEQSQAQPKVELAQYYHHHHHYYYHHHHHHYVVPFYPPYLHHYYHHHHHHHYYYNNGY